ncbi:MAG: SusD/RagB family nutrient-binding outer membrane lipoprotein, partial [Chryseosolibacter sp.]
NKLKIYLYALLASGVVLASSCTNDYEEINTNKNTVATVGPAELPFLFARALSAVPWNDQTAQNLYADQYAQYFANNTSYFPTDRLVIEMSWANGPWSKQYTVIVPQLQTLFANTDPASAEYALANIWWVYSFHRVTDYWGPIPYSKAGIPGTSVPYDAQSAIYDDFFKRLDEAVEVLKTKPATEKPFGAFDIIYAGDITKWIKFANTLRLRLALRVSKVDANRARTEAEAAYAEGVFTISPDHDAKAQKHAVSDRNPISVMSEWNEFRMTAAMESALVGYDDPRLPEYFIPAKKTGTYEGLRNGLSIAQLGDAMNKPDANSHVGPRWTDPVSGGLASFLSTPANVMCTAEAYFLRAEGALLGWNMGGSAKELYEAGITNSMKQWGIADATAVADYINSMNTPVPPGDFLNTRALSDVPVKFNEADQNVQLEQIAMQKWLALFPDGVEAWADFRRQDVLPLYPVANSDNLDITDPTTQTIKRLPFLTSEIQTNGTEVEKAVQLLGGTDKVTTNLWWDVN